MPGDVTLRILNVVEAPAGKRRVDPPKTALPMAAFSLEPCTECTASCCTKRVMLTTVEALRIAYALGLRLRSFLAPLSWEERYATWRGWPAKLEGGRTVLSFARASTTSGGPACVHLVRPGQATSRCGIYELRPGNCRLYPFVVELEQSEPGEDGAPRIVARERIPAGSQEACPVQWLQDDDTRERAASDLIRHREDLDVDRALVRRWNRGQRDRGWDAFLTWLEVDVAAELGHEPERLKAFGG